MIKHAPVKLPNWLALTAPRGAEEVLACLDMIALLDAGTTGTGRATFYNTRTAQEDSVFDVHTSLLRRNRGAYVMALLLPGLTDYARQMGIKMLLSNPFGRGGFVPKELEMLVIKHLLRGLPVHRMLGTFVELRKSKINNRRTRGVVLGILLNAPRLELWSVRYRDKVRRSLVHVWGRRRASVLAAILERPAGSLKVKEREMLREMVDRHVKNAEKLEEVHECLRFALGSRGHYKGALFKAFVEVRKDFQAGAVLPFEVLEGLRSTWHKHRPTASALALTKGQLTKGQQIRVQAQAEKLGVETSFDATKYDAAQLYVYAYARGLGDGIREALAGRAVAGAEGLPFQLGRVGILVDNSQSMVGGSDQALRPLAMVMAARDLLVAGAEEAVVEYVYPVKGDGELPVARGHTQLAWPFYRLLEKGVEVIFVLSDGYENAPATRLRDVITALPKIGMGIPVVQLSPVMSAEADGIRLLHPGILALGFHKVEDIGTGMLKLAFHQGWEAGMVALWGLVKRVAAWVDWKEEDAKN